MRAIILAAGLGSRLNEYTRNKPKCLLQLGDKTLLQRQLDAYAANRIQDIHLVRGYRGEAITYDGITYHDNPDYRTNNVLKSLFYAESALKGDVIVSYSDIVFTPLVVELLMRSTHEISIVVDVDWQDRYVGRRDHPVAEAENVIFDAERRVLKIGKNIDLPSGMNGEFIGMLKLNPLGADLFRGQFHRAKNAYWGRRFQRAATFENAYLTDMLQEMTDNGLSINCVMIHRGWIEIDTVEDYMNALKEFG
jgi:choline kinase